MGTGFLGLVTGAWGLVAGTGGRVTGSLCRIARALRLVSGISGRTTGTGGRVTGSSAGITRGRRLGSGPCRTGTCARGWGVPGGLRRRRVARLLRLGLPLRSGRVCPRLRLLLAAVVFHGCRKGVGCLLRLGAQRLQLLPERLVFRVVIDALRLPDGVCRLLWILWLQVAFLVGLLRKIQKKSPYLHMPLRFVIGYIRATNARMKNE